MAGVDLLSADDFDDPRLTRHVSRALVLIADEAAIEGHEGGCDGLLKDDRWFRVVVLSPGACPLSDDPRLIRLERANAARAIAALLPDWRLRLR